MEIELNHVITLQRELNNLKTDVAMIKSKVETQEAQSKDIFQKLDSIKESISGLERAPDKKKVAFVNWLIAVVLTIIIAVLTAISVNMSNTILEQTRQWHEADASDLQRLRLQLTNPPRPDESHK